jgi:DAK2 domain fusion protein YloV
VLESLDAAAVRRWCAAGVAVLREHQREIDELNVFPVPDGDTGTNLLLTVASADEALAAEPDGDEPTDPGELTRLGRVLGCMARGALLGARGNSGVILAQLLRGLADALAVTPSARGRVVAGALGEAVASAYTVVAEPVEGTLLSVAKGAAEAASAADSDDLAAVVSAAARGAAEALARTPAQLPVLARAGVVDAGGRGLVLILEALVQVVTGAAVATAPLAAVAADPALLDVPRETGSTGYAYEVQYLLDAPTTTMATLKAALAGLGDSLVVVGTGLTGADGPTWNVHVHVNDAGAAIEAGVRGGRPHRISVTRFADQLAGTVAHPATGTARTRAVGALPDEPAGTLPDEPADALRDQPVGRVAGRAADTAPGGVAGDPGPRAPGAGPTVIAVAEGAGLAALFSAESARVPAGRPGVTELLAEITGSGADRVILLPNDPELIDVANLAAGHARDGRRRVAVVPTRSPVQGLAALAVHDPARRFEDDVIAMAEAAGACRCGAVSHTGGEVIGWLDGQPELTGVEVGAVACELLDLLLRGGGELVTLLAGARPPDGLADALTGHLRAHWAGVEVAWHDGGQAQVLLVGVE